MKIPFSKVECNGSELRYVQQVLESGWVTTAGKAMEFEQRFTAAVGGKYACAVNSCTAALHLALEAADVGPGDKVLVPTLTFTATAEIVRYLGADPVFADVEYGTALLTPEIVEAALERNPGIKAVVVVHFGGQAAEMTRDQRPETAGDGQRTTETPKHQNAKALGILDVCRRRGVKVIEDAAHAFPTRLNGRSVGSFGDITCFSFYANKTITTGEGGMLVTDDEAVFKRTKVMRLHGIDRDIWNRFTSDKPSWEYDVVAPGFKYNMPDINAAIGLAQLERAEEMRKERQRCFEFYLRELADCEWLDLPVIRPQSDPNNASVDQCFDDPILSTLNSTASTALQAHSCHLFWVVLKEGAPVTRNHFIELLSKAGIGTSVHYKPLHRMRYYRERYGLNPQGFPNAEKHWHGCVSLPVYPSMTDEQLGYVVKNVKLIIGVQTKTAMLSR